MPRLASYLLLLALLMGGTPVCIAQSSTRLSPKEREEVVRPLLQYLPIREACDQASIISFQFVIRDLDSLLQALDEVKLSFDFQADSVALDRFSTFIKEDSIWTQLSAKEMSWDPKYSLWLRFDYHDEHALGDTLRFKIEADTQQYNIHVPIHIRLPKILLKDNTCHHLLKDTISLQPGQDSIVFCLEYEGESGPVFLVKKNVASFTFDKNHVDFRPYRTEKLTVFTPARATQWQKYPAILMTQKMIVDSLGFSFYANSSQVLDTVFLHIYWYKNIPALTPRQLFAVSLILLVAIFALLTYLLIKKTRHQALKIQAGMSVSKFWGWMVKRYTFWEKAIAGVIGKPNSGVDEDPGTGDGAMGNESNPKEEQGGAGTTPNFSVHVSELQEVEVDFSNPGEEQEAPSAAEEVPAPASYYSEEIRAKASVFSHFLKMHFQKLEDEVNAWVHQMKPAEGKVMQRLLDKYLEVLMKYEADIIDIHWVAEGQKPKEGGIVNTQLKIAANEEVQISNLTKTVMAFHLFPLYNAALILLEELINFHFFVNQAQPYEDLLHACKPARDLLIRKLEEILHIQLRTVSLFSSFEENKRATEVLRFGEPENDIYRQISPHLLPPNHILEIITFGRKGTMNDKVEVIVSD